jgi:hypothetical protein
VAKVEQADVADWQKPEMRQTTLRAMLQAMLAERCKVVVHYAPGMAGEARPFAAGAPDGPVLNAGKYIVIWKRQPTGEWKTHRDIFNWDIPPAPPVV